MPLGYRSVDKKLEVVPAEADLVRKIFADYLRFGPIAALATSLNAEGLKPKPRKLTNGRSIQAEAFTIGPLAHLLKNRFYVGEVAYKGEVHPGSQEPIVSRELFEMVQARIADGRVARQALRSASPAILTGKLFDDRGHAMSPTHANKAGVRYRYYTSQALLQGRKADAGSISRVSAPEVERLVLQALDTAAQSSHATSERHQIERSIDRIVVGTKSLAIMLQPSDDEPTAAISVPFVPSSIPRKGVMHAPACGGRIDTKTQAVLLAAIARSIRWIDEITSDASADFHHIAEREGVVERHIRLLAPLAFLSPRIIKAIAEGRAPSGLTVTSLARDLPIGWHAQETRLL